MNAKGLFILHLPKEKIFILVIVNRNSYEPRWCQRPVVLQNRRVEVFCFAGARGRSRRDLPSSHTTAGHQTAERRQTQTVFGKLLPRGGQTAKKAPFWFTDSQQNKATKTQSQNWSAAVWWTVPLHSNQGSHLKLLSEGFVITTSRIYLPGWIFPPI